MIIKYAESQGRDKLAVNGVYSFNERSRRMYESLGFIPTEKYVDDDGNESVRFELKLGNR